MKVAFVLPNWPSRNETAITNQIAELNKEDVDAKTFLAFNIEDLKYEKLPKEISQFKLDQNVILIKQPKLISKNKLISKLYVYLTSIPYLIRTFFYSPKVFYKAIFNKKYGEQCKNFKIIFAIQNLLKKKLVFDIIHCQYAPFGIWGAIFVDLGLVKGKVVTSFRGYGINKLPKYKPKDYYDFLINSCKIFTSNTNFTKKNAIKIGFPENNIHIIRTSLQTANYEYKKKSFKENEDFIIFSAGALREVKGHEYSIRAIKIVLEKYPNINLKFIIAGDGYLKDSLTELIKVLNLDKHVFLIGFIDHIDIKKYYNDSHLFLLSSITTSDGNQEAQGLVVQEAQACGIPVICSNSGGIPDGFVDKKSGFLVEEKNPEQITEKIIYCIENYDEVSKFGEYGRKFVEDNFNVSIETKKLIELYKTEI